MEFRYQKYYSVRILLIIFILHLSCLLSAQSDNNSNRLESELNESIAENPDNSNIPGEELQELKDRPIDLNSAIKSDFEALPLLTPFQIASILEYRETHGLFTSVYELSGVDALSAETIESILPYVSVNQNYVTGALHQNSGIHQHVILKTERVLQSQTGYAYASDSMRANHPTQFYAGSAQYLKTRYKINVNDKFYAGFTLEKDAGETLFRGNNSTFDFNSGFAEYKGYGKLKNIIAGDYKANFGQGLAMWSGYAIGKSAYAASIYKSNEGFSAFTSSNENQYLRGIAATFSVFNIRISPWMSKKNRDANLVALDSLGENVAVSSLQNTGYHTIASEIADKDALGETCVGLNVNRSFGILKLGSTYVKTQYSLPFLRGTSLYQKFAFQGRKAEVVSANYKIEFRNFNIFGEAAQGNTGNAFLNGLQIQMTPQLTFAMLYRNMTPSFYAPYANAFSSSGNSSNEKGLYNGFEFLLFQHWKLSAYTDFVKHDWPTYNASFPSSAQYYFAELSYSRPDSFSASLRYNSKSLEADANSAFSGIDPLTYSTQNKIRLNVAYKIAGGLEFRNRIEWVTNKLKIPGILIYQDVIYKSATRPFSLTGRYAWFDAPDWQTRIYAYENDVLYASSTALYYGKGARFYALAKYKFNRMCTLWLRYSATIYSDRQTIGIGPAQISGNLKSELSVQFMVAL